MQKYKILNFQNLKITEAQVSDKPFDKTSFDDKNIMTVVIIRDPFDYFDILLIDYIYTAMSPNLKKEALTQMRILSNEAFLEWFSTLNYLPLINPQTFQLDIKKRIDIAIENLRHFNYVIPYECINLFIEKVTPNISIEQPIQKNSSFSLSNIKNSLLINRFIEKDILLYQEALKLWKQIKENNFKALSNQKPSISSLSHNYEGIVGKIDSTSIRGWVVNCNNYEECVLIGIYKNGILLEKVLANKLRPDIQKNKGYPTEKCGFIKDFKTPTFKKGDKVEVKTMKDNITIVLSRNTKKFLAPIETVQSFVSRDR